MWVAECACRWRNLDCDRVHAKLRGEGFNRSSCRSCTWLFCSWCRVLRRLVSCRSRGSRSPTHHAVLPLQLYHL